MKNYRYRAPDKLVDSRTGGEENVGNMLHVLFERHVAPVPSFAAAPTVVETPGIGCLHPLSSEYFLSPAAYLEWRLAASTATEASRRNFTLASPAAPRVAVLLFRKHVITDQPYIPELIETMERQGLLPVATSVASTAWRRPRVLVT